MSQGYASEGLPLNLPWKLWTPTYENITVGNGTEVARFVGEPGGLIVAQWMLTFGDSTTMGSTHTISLPLPSDISFTALRLNLGPALLFENGGTLTHGYVKRTTATLVALRVFTAGSTYLQEAVLTATVPHTWGTLDIASFNIKYEAA